MSVCGGVCFWGFCVYIIVWCFLHCCIVYCCVIVCFFVSTSSLDISSFESYTIFDSVFFVGCVLCLQLKLYCCKCNSSSIVFFFDLEGFLPFLVFVFLLNLSCFLRNISVFVQIIIDFVQIISDFLRNISDFLRNL